MRHLTDKGGRSINSSTIALVLYLSCGSAVTRKITSNEWTLSKLSASVDLWDKFNYPHLDTFRDTIDQIISSKNIHLSSMCRRDLSLFTLGIANRTLDAMKMIDSFSQRKSGGEFAVYFDFGHSSLCESVRLNETPGKLHLLSVTSPMPTSDQANQLSMRQSLSPRDFSLMQVSMVHQYLPLMYAVCLPLSCNGGDISSALSSSVLRERLPVKLDLIEEPKIPLDSTAFICARLMCKLVIASVLLICVTCTYILNESTSPVIKCFNMNNNVRSLFSRPSNDCSSLVISSFKLGYICITTSAHIMLPITTHAIYPVHGPFLAVVFAPYARYSSFALSAALTGNFVVSSALSLFKWYPIFTTHSVKLVQFVVIRVLRIIPLMLFVMCLLIILPDVFDTSDPLLRMSLVSMSNNCWQNGWQELLFISNYGQVDKMCLPVCWFVSADMQLYIASYVIICCIRKWRSIYKCTVPVIVIGFTAMMARFNTYTPLLKLFESPVYFLANPLPFFKESFATPNFVAGYAIGIILGYKLLQENRLSKTRAIFYLIFANTLQVASLVVPYHFDMATLSPWLNVTILALQRITLPWGVGVMLYAVRSLRSLKSSDQVGTFDHITSVLSRLEYPYFLVHPFVISYLAITLKVSHASHLAMYLSILPSQAIISLLIATILHVLVEAPCARLIKLALQSSVSASTKQHKQ